MATEEAFYTSKWGKVVVLNRQNYHEFKPTATATLISADAWDIVQGTDPAPANLTNPAGKEWKTRRGRALQILYNSVSTGIRSSLDLYMELQDPVRLWEHLATYSNAEDKLFITNILQTFHNDRYKPPNDTIETYANRLQKYQNSLAETTNPITDEALHLRLAMGLPDTETWNIAKQFLLNQHTEFQGAVKYLQSIEINQRTIEPEPAANIANQNQRNQPRNNRFRNRHFYKNNRRYRNQRNGDQSDQSEQNPLEKNQCSWCLRTGHWQKDCYAYKKAKGKAQSKSRSRQNRQNNQDQEQANIASAYVSTAIINQSRNDWIIDSGATNHISGYLGHFLSIKRFREPRAIRIANGSIVQAYGYGSTAVTAALQLPTVWYAPEFDQTSLISVNMLNSDGIEVRFLPNKAVIGLRGSVQLFTGYEHNGLRKINQSETAFISQEARLQSETSQSTPISTATETDIELWHRRLGHTNYKAIEQLPSLVLGIPKFKAQNKPPGEHACESCLAGGMKETFNKKSDNRTDQKIGRIHADLSGIKSPSYNGNRYFLLLVDDATRQTWVYFTKTKEAKDILLPLKHFKAKVELETSCKIVLLRADNGKSEFGKELQEELKIRGIQLEPSPPYKHSLNGVVERAMQTINKTVRSIIYEGKLPIEIWEFATEYAVYIKNRVPTKALPFESITSTIPYEAYYNKKPDLSNIRAFGTVAFPVYPKDKHPAKYDPKIQPDHIFIGLRGSHIYRLFNYKTLKETYSADCKFNEYIYPLKETAQNIAQREAQKIGQRTALRGLELANREAARTPSVFPTSRQQGAPIIAELESGSPTEKAELYSEPRGQPISIAEPRVGKRQKKHTSTPIPLESELRQLGSQPQAKNSLTVL